MTTDYERVKDARESIEKVLCLAPHPIYGVLCIKTKGHDKRHWFTASWDGDETPASLLKAALEGER